MELTFDVKLTSFTMLFSQMNVAEYRNFVKHSLQVAKITREITKLLSSFVDPDCAYLAGMLHDVGLVLRASTENYESFIDMFKRVPDLEKIVLKFDKSDKHPILSYMIGSLVKPLCPLCAKGIIYHHKSYQQIDESEKKVVYLANCIKVADTISLINLRHNAEELTVGILNEMINAVQKDSGIVEDVRKAALEILRDYRVLCEMLDDEDRFSSERTLTLEEFEHPARVLAALLDLRSPYTRNHTFIVTKISQAITEEIATKEDARYMQIASLLHDIGKLKTPLSISHKMGTLDSDEFIIMKRHVVDTYRMLENANLTSIAKISAAHHERLDGSGYPFGLNSDRTTIHQRIIQVCDVFSALVERRPYRNALNTSEALRIIEGEVSAGKLDSTVFEILKELVKNGIFDEEIVFRNVLESLFEKSFEEIREFLELNNISE